jgi:hypothetical protein
VAIASSKLGHLVRGVEWIASPDEVIRRLRDAALLKPEATDGEIASVLKAAADEHIALDQDEQQWNTPSERVRFFLAPYLSDKGRAWAEPLKSLDLPDDQVE